MPPYGNGMSPLKKFGFGVGYIQLVVYFIIIIYSMYALMTTSHVSSPSGDVANTTQIAPLVDETTVADVTETVTVIVTTSVPPQEKTAFLVWVPMVYLLLAIVCLITVIGLIYGLQSDSAEFLLPWLIFHIIAIIVVFCVGIARQLTAETFTEVRLVIFLFFAGSHGFVVYLIYVLYNEMDGRL